MKTFKIISKIFILLLFFQIIYIPTTKAGLSDIILNADDFLIEGKQENQGTEVIEGSDGTTIEMNKQIINEEELKKFNDVLFNIALTTGIILSVIVGAIIGIMLMWGSIEQQIKAKEILLPYVIACCVIFGAFTIWKVVAEMGDSMSNSSITNSTATYSTCPQCGHEVSLPPVVIHGNQDHQCPYCDYYGKWQ